MKYTFYLLCPLLITLKIYAQPVKKSQKPLIYIAPEIAIGKTMEANQGFPETSIQKAFFVSLGFNTNKEKAWKRQLGYPTTGISLSITDFGNTQKIGKAYTVMPFLETSFFSQKKHPIYLQVGMGASYMDTQYHPVDNPYNKAITTKINWSFRSFLYYDIFRTNHMDWRMGLGYIHHSNGHTRLPNQGLNSFVASVSSIIPVTKQVSPSFRKVSETKENTPGSTTFISGRFGLGYNVLSQTFNAQKEVYSVAFSAGKIYKNTFKFGGGFYYRFYQHYYDHIKNDEELIEEQVPFFRESPFRYATNFGVFASAELLLGHVGLSTQIGLNIYKPFYKIDWQLSQGYYANDTYYKEDLNWYYEIKRTVSSRMGIKYYLRNTNTSPKHNVFVSAHINANLGQADFSEISIGYVHQFAKK